MFIIFQFRKYHEPSVIGRLILFSEVRVLLVGSFESGDGLMKGERHVARRCFDKFSNCEIPYGQEAVPSHLLKKQIS